MDMAMDANNLRVVLDHHIQEVLIGHGEMASDEEQLLVLDIRHFLNLYDIGLLLKYRELAARIMVAAAQMDATLETRNNQGDILGLVHYEVAQAIHIVIVGDALVPDLDDMLIHLRSVGEGTVTVADNVFREKMGIRDKPNLGHYLTSLGIKMIYQNTISHIGQALTDIVGNYAKATMHLTDNLFADVLKASAM